MTIQDHDQLRHTLEALYQHRRQEMREQWQRDLPLTELLFDRWERARHLGFGEKTSIYHNSYVFGDVRVGSNTWIGPFTLLDGSGGLAIGDFCSISSGVQIYTHDTVKWALSGGKASYEHAPVKIGNCCYIGPDSIVTKGVEIGDHSLVGAQSLVNRSLPAFSIALGTPARVVGKVVLDKGDTVRLEYFDSGRG